jgi:Xaa-Pro aminopeptidase
LKSPSDDCPIMNADSDAWPAGREQRLDDYLDERDLEAVWFARPNAFAWVTGGDNVVDRDGDVGVAAVGYDGAFRVVTDNIEAQRLLDEELPADATVETAQWYDESLATAVADRSPTPAAADFDVPGFERVDATDLRQPLTEADIERYRELGRDAADAVERVCRELEPDDTEHEVAAGLRISLAARDINAPVVLVGGERRAQQYRHYTPSKESLGGYALLSVTAERDGLYASLTRTVTFDPPEWLDERFEAASAVETTALAATRAVGRQGGTAADVFEDVMDAYDAVGYADEWRNHHQGGAAGYAGREWIATPDLDREVHLPMAYAWNPTVQGAKSEDTVLVTDDGFEVLTETGDWPTTTVSAHGYDVTVPRHRPLDAD